MNWPVVNLPEICRPRQWPTIQKTQMLASGYTLYGANGPIGYYSEYNHEEPTVLITCRGATCGTINLCEPKSYVTGNAMALDDLDVSRVNMNYLIYALRGGDFSAVITGMAQPQITGQSLSRLEIPLPPLAEQKRIAGILDAADALRAKRRAALAQLDSLTQSLFLDLFGDPVSNPMGWEQSELGDLVATDDRINYGVVQPGDEHPGGKPLIRVGDFVGGELDLSGIKFISPEIDAQYERSRLLGTELLVSCVGSIGTVCRVPAEAKGHNIARAVARVPLGSKVEREFMLFCLRSAGVQNYFASETRTVSQPTLNIGLIKTATVTVPPLSLQRRFAAMVESIERQKTRHRAHLAELDALFASLQHHAFRGEL